MSVVYCPFCLGYAYRQQSIGLLLNGEAARAQARANPAQFRPQRNEWLALQQDFRA